MARSPLTLVVLLSLPLVGLAILLAAPETDVHWEHHPSHFWLVLVTAALNAVLAYATGVAARRRGDRRVHLVSLSFLAASGFLALHALATPGVLLDKPNLCFVIATPVGLVLAGAFAVLSAIDSEPVQPKYLERTLLVLLALWAIVCLSFFPEVDDSVVPARLSSELVALSVVGVRYGQREKIFDAVIDKVEVKQISELSPREIEHDNPEIRRPDEMTRFLGQLYNRPVSEDETVTVIRFSQIIGSMF